MGQRLLRAPLAPPGLFSGCKGLGAEDAWYLTALAAELCKLEGVHFTCTTFDLYKAFDRLVRPVIYLAMIKAGWPGGAVKAYMGYMEALEVSSSFAGVGRKMSASSASNSRKAGIGLSGDRG